MPDNSIHNRKILFVDDDPEFLQMIDRLMKLRSKGSWEIFTAPGPGAAMAILQEQAIHLVVIDVCMPVVDGLQFLSMLQRRFPDMQKVVLTGYATEAYRSACLANGAELFLEKPRTPEGIESIFATLHELARWQPEPGFRGVLRRVGLMDVVQMECLARNSSVLAVNAGGTNGNLYIKAGSIIHAESGDLKGDEAAYKLLTLANGDFHLKPLVQPPEETIQTQWEHLLMEAARLRDETPQPKEKKEARSPQFALNGPRVEEKLNGKGKTHRRKIEELLICSSAGDVLHAWQCVNPDFRMNFIEFLSQRTRSLQGSLKLDPFDRVEFVSSEGRMMAQLRPGHSIVLRTGVISEEEEKTTPRPARLQLPAGPPSAARKNKAEKWFEGHRDVAGVLAAGLQFTDKTGVNHAISTEYTAGAVENLRRTMSETFQVLGLQKIPGNRARWIYENAVIDSAQWTDGTCVVYLLSRKAVELDARQVDQQIQNFLSEGINT